MKGVTRLRKNSSASALSASYSAAIERQGQARHSMRQKLSDPGAFETRRVATEAAMLEDILRVEFNTLGELRAEHAAPLTGEVSPIVRPWAASGWHCPMPFVMLSGRCCMLFHMIDRNVLQIESRRGNAAVS